MNKILKKMVVWTALLTTSLGWVWNSFVYAEDIADPDRLRGMWKSYGNVISPIQVEIGGTEGSRYMLPTYATPSNIGATNCSPDPDAFENKPEGAIRYNCPDVNALKGLLKSLKISNSHTTYAEGKLWDLSIPKYYVLEQDVIVKNKEFITIEGTKIKYQESDVGGLYGWDEKAIFGIYDPDIGRRWDNKNSLEGKTYWRDGDTPNLGIEVYPLDGSRLSTESLRAGIYTIEHYLTPSNESKTFDGQELFGTSNSLKYTLNQYTSKMEEKVFRDVCSEPKGGVKLFKNDDYNYGWGLKFRTFLKNPNGMRVDAVDGGDCNSVNGLLSSRTGMITGVEDNIVGIDEDESDNATNGAYFVSKNDNSSFEDRKILGLKNDFGNNSIVNVGVDKVGIIGDTRHFVNSDLDSIRDYYEGKTVRLYYLIKVTSHWDKPLATDGPWAKKLSLRNKYANGLDPLNPHYWNRNVNNSTSEEYVKYLYGPSRLNSPSSNYYVMLGAAFKNSENPSTVYELSAPGYAQKASAIKNGANDAVANSRIRNMVLNISQAYQQTDTVGLTHGDYAPNLYLMSPTRVVAPGNSNNPNVISRNYDADMDNKKVAFATNSNMENNLDFVAAYKGSDTNFKEYKNSASGDGLISIGAEHQFWAQVGTESFPNQKWDCWAIGVSSSLFPSIYSLHGNCAEKGQPYSSRTMSGDSSKYGKMLQARNYNNLTFYQQFQGAITKKNPNAPDAVNKGMLLQTVANMGDSEVYNQIYMNTNFMIGLPNREDMECEINLNKMPTTTAFTYGEKIDKDADLAADAVYGKEAANPFMPSVGSYVDKTIVDHLLNRSPNQSAYDAYYDKHYGDYATGNRQKWLVGEKGIVTYNCKKNTSVMDEVVIEVRTSDEKFTFDNTTKDFTRLPNTDKLKTPLLTFNTGSQLGYRRMQDSESDIETAPNIENFKGPIQDIEENGFTKRILGSKDNAQIKRSDIYLGRKSKNPGLFNGGIEVSVPNGTGKDKYGKVDVVIYDKNRPGQVLDAKTYYITTNKVGDTPETPPVDNTPPHGYCNVIEQIVPFGGKGGDLWVCDPDGGGEVKNDNISLEESFISGNSVTYKLVCGNSGGQEFKGKLNFNISGLYRMAESDDEGNVSYSVNLPWGNSADIKSHGFTIKDFRIPGKQQAEITVTIPLKKREPSCPDSPLTASAQLSSATKQNGLPSKTNTVNMVECKMPTLKFKSVEASDGNKGNDRTPGTWSSAYPFEFNQCGNSLTYSVEAEYKCFDKDPTAKDLEVRFTGWTVTDGLGLNRNPFADNNWYAGPIFGVSPVKSGKTAVWDLSKSTQSFNGSMANGRFRAHVSVNPPKEGHMRIAGNKFEIQKLPTNRTLKLESGGGIVCGGAGCHIPTLTSDIGLDPVVESEKMFDNGIYADTNPMHAFLHREEIDGKSTKNGQPHYEPVRYITRVSNPAVNGSVYGLNSMNFDMNANSTNKLYFEKINPETSAQPSGTHASIYRGDISWNSLNLPAGSNISVGAVVNLYKNLRTPNHTPSNSSELTKGHTSMDFSQDGSQMCSFKVGFKDWESGIKRNPITIDRVMIEEVPPYSPMKDPNNPRLTIEQHLPGDTMKLLLDIQNNNPTRTFNDTFIRMKFNRTGSGVIDESDKELDMTKLFKLGGIDDNGWTVMKTGELKCKMEPDNILCKTVNPLTPGQTLNAAIFLEIDVESQFYKKLKSVSQEKNWKFWYPIVIDEIKYGSPDLNLVDGTVYYTSDENTKPSGSDIDDVGEYHLDFNMPINRELKPAPYDSNFAFHVGIPYAVIENSFTNLSAGNFSVGDLGRFTTKIKNIGKASIKNPEVIQDLYHLDIQKNYVDTDIVKVTVSPSSEKTSIKTAKTVDFSALNNDTNPNNDVKVKNIPYLSIKGWPQNNVDYTLVGDDKIEVYPALRPFFIDGSENLKEGGAVEIKTDVMFTNLKDSKFPQIDCYSETSCKRPGTNPKDEEFKGQLDLVNIGDAVDEETTAQYKVHFPILKSILFSKTGSDFRPADGSNTNIQGKVNSDDTTVTYRVDNFIPQEYKDYANEKVGKARTLEARIKLPTGVKYVPGTLKVVNNIQDGTVDPAYNTIADAGFDPEVKDVRDYQIIKNGANNFEEDFLTSGKWNKVTGTNEPEYALMKGTPFILNFFGDAYNFYRVTNDGALALGRKTVNSNLEESDYIVHKKNVSIRATTPTTLHFSQVRKDITPRDNNVSYISEDGEIKRGQANRPFTVAANTTIVIPANTIVNLTEGLEGVTFKSGEYVITNDINRDFVNAPYTLIAPLYKRLDTSKKPEHGVYERVVKDASGKVTTVKYIWYGYIEGDVNAEVKFGVSIYSNKGDGEFVFSYSKNSPYIRTLVEDDDFKAGLNKWTQNVDDLVDVGKTFSPSSMPDAVDISISFATSYFYQELKLPVGYKPDPLDAVRGDVILPQEKDASGMFVKGPGKDQTSTIYQFNVRISTTEQVCGSEYVNSLGGGSLRWGKLTSNRSDREDIDMFCFSAKKPTIKILDNASYARGGYKSANNNCTVNHLALMGFNSKAIGWNETTDNGCWLTYNIQSYEKDLSIYTTSPYDLLSRFKDKIDTKPIDNTLITNNKKLTFATIASDSNPDVGTIRKPLAFKAYNDKTFFTIAEFGNGTGKKWGLLSLRIPGKWTKVKEFTKTPVAAHLDTRAMLVFFEDGSYAVNTKLGAWEWEEKRLVDYSGGIRNIHFYTTSNGYILGNNGIVWTTTDNGVTWTKTNFKTAYNLNNSEELNKMTSFGGKDLWMVTSHGNILHSSDAGNTWTKKTTGVGLDKKIWDFEDGSITILDNNKQDYERTNTSATWIDTVDNGQSLKFDNLSAYQQTNPLNGNTKYIQSINLPTSSAAKQYFTTGNKAPRYNFAAIKDNNTKKLNGIITMDFFFIGANQYDLDKIVFTGTNGKLEILNPEQFTPNKKFVEGKNTLTINVSNSTSGGKYVQTGDLTGDLTLEVYGKTANKQLTNTSGAIGAIQVAQHNIKPTFSPVLPKVNGSNYPVYNGRGYAYHTNNLAIISDASGNNNNIIDLSDSVDATGKMKGSLVMDLYISYIGDTPVQGIIIKIASRKGPFIQYPLVSVVEWGDVALKTPGWKKVRIPMSGIGSVSHKNSWNGFDGKIDEISFHSWNASKYQYFAIDNIGYSASANIEMLDVQYFNEKEGVLIGYDKSSNQLVRYLTFDNQSWSVVETWGNMQRPEVIESEMLKWREAYWYINRLGNMFTLDKGRNFKVNKDNKYQNYIEKISTYGNEVYTIYNGIVRKAIFVDG